MAYESKRKNEETDALFTAILSLKDLDECYMFFEDLCTIDEMQSLGQRWAVAQMLEEGITYNTIAAKTGASSATISRVNRALVYGAEGYRLALSRREK